MLSYSSQFSWKCWYFREFKKKQLLTVDIRFTNVIRKLLDIKTTTQEVNAVLYLWDCQIKVNSACKFLFVHFQNNTIVYASHRCWKLPRRLLGKMMGFSFERCSSGIRINRQHNILIRNKFCRFLFCHFLLLLLLF